MSEYEFTLKFKLPDPDANPEDYIEALAEAGCDDALVGVGHPGHISLEFIREADSAQSAVYSAILNVKDAIDGVVLLEASPDLVGITDVANILDVTRQAIRKLVDKSHGAFPSPIYDNAVAIYSFSDVLKWMRENTRREIDGPLQEIADLNRLINLYRDAKRSAPTNEAIDSCLGQSIPKDVRAILGATPQLIR
jgi:hypothetical protein